MHSAPEPLVPAADALADPGALRTLARELGYLYLPALVDLQAIAAARRALREFCVAEGFAEDHADDPPWLDALATPRWDGMRPGSPRWLAVQREIFSRPAVQALRDEPALVAAIERLFGERAKSGMGDLCRVVMPHRLDETTPPHQDHGLPDAESHTWTAWLPLVDCPLELGPLAVMPGSHRQGLREHSTDASRSVAVSADEAWSVSPVVPGDVILFNGFTVHKALPNLSPTRIRLSVDLRYWPLKRWAGGGAALHG